MNTDGKTAIHINETTTTSTTEGPIIVVSNTTESSLLEDRHEENEADTDLYYDKDVCSLQEYEILKVRLYLLHLL